jgi:hypothetical protein
MQQAIQITRIAEGRDGIAGREIKEREFFKKLLPVEQPLLLVAKKMDASGKQKFRLVVDYCKLNKMTVSDTCPLPDITETVGS